MKISKLIIKKLHNEFDYSVNFNEDITFLYGENGCGKTTILTLISNIITGKIYKLFEFQFEYIRLIFGKDSFIHIVRDIAKIDISLKVFGQTKSSYIKNMTNFYIMDGDRTDSELTIRYLKDNIILREITNLFDQEFLPIRRSITLDDSVKVNIFGGVDVYRRIHYKGSDDTKIEDIVMAQVNGLIRDKYNQINTSIKEIDENFKVNVLKSFSEIYKLSSPDELFNKLVYGNDGFIDKIAEVKTEYRKILENLNLSMSIDLRAYYEFFEEFSNDISRFKKNKDIVSDFERLTNLLLKYQELKRLDEIISLANDAEKEKQIVSKPLDQFMNVVNDFMATANVQKKVMINREGEAVVDVGEGKSKRTIPLAKLSSGEKQIIIFFAHLILKIDKSKESIFIIDEPEMSLHPYWQKIFVDKLVEVNSNMQLIFATHSPEIVGKRRDRMVKLIRQ